MSINPRVLIFMLSVSTLFLSIDFAYANLPSSKTIQLTTPLLDQPLVKLSKHYKTLIERPSNDSSWQLSRLLTSDTRINHIDTEERITDSTQSFPTLLSMVTHVPNHTLKSLGSPTVLIRSLSPVKLTVLLTFDFGDA